MPDQSSAATEHAILQEITAPLETLPDDPVALVNADFPVALRGYDRMAVDAYVQRASQLVAELQATRSPDAAIRRALERVGEQISGVLQRAHDTAEQITAQSRREAEDRVEKSRLEAAEVAASAQQRVSDLDADTDRIWAERKRIVEDARELAGQLLALADTAAERFPAAETAGYEAETASVRAPIPVDGAEAAYDGYQDGAGYEDDAVYEDEASEETEETGARTEHKLEPPVRAPAPIDDIEATVAFSPIEPTTDEAADLGDEPRASPPPPLDPRRSSSVIPPASQAANRRSSR